MKIDYEGWVKAWLLLLLIELVMFMGKALWDLGDVIHKLAQRF